MRTAGDSLRAAALRNRPELAQLDRQVTAAKSQVEVVGATLKPTVSLALDAGSEFEVHRT